MLRLLFEKTGEAVWISHLDLMRLFQRAFKRAGLPLTHTKGFNPRPSVSIALPMSVGVESRCELLDFTLDTENAPIEQLPQMLNEKLIPGVRVLQAYDNGRKLRELSLMRALVTLTYDNGVPEGAIKEIRQLFAKNEIIVPKKSKNGITDQNIAPMIRKIEVTSDDSRHILLEAVICCQDPALNPMQLGAAVSLHLPAFAPDDCTCQRLEVYDNQEVIFR